MAAVPRRLSKAISVIQLHLKSMENCVQNPVTFPHMAGIMPAAPQHDRGEISQGGGNTAHRRGQPQQYGTGCKDITACFTFSAKLCHATTLTLSSQEIQDRLTTKLMRSPLVPPGKLAHVIVPKQPPEEGDQA